jgi:hypothetical protein
MMKTLVIIFLSVTFSAINVFANTFEDNIAIDELPVSNSGGATIKLEHSFDNGRTYTSRGSITILSFRSGAASIESNDLSQKDKDALQSLCDEDGLYLVRAIMTGEAVSSYRTAAHACNLIDTGLSDIFSVQLDWRHKVVALYLSTPTKLNKVPLTTLTGFNSKAYVQHMESGPAPDTSTFIQKIETEKLAQQRGETKDNRSFLAKYWMYIVPVVLVLVMSGAQDGGGGGGR